MILLIVTWKNSDYDTVNSMVNQMSRSNGCDRISQVKGKNHWWKWLQNRCLWIMELRNWRLCGLFIAHPGFWRARDMFRRPPFQTAPIKLTGLSRNGYFCHNTSSEACWVHKQQGHRPFKGQHSAGTAATLAKCSAPTFQAWCHYSCGRPARKHKAKLHTPFLKAKEPRKQRGNDKSHSSWWQKSRKAAEAELQKPPKGRLKATETTRESAAKNATRLKEWFQSKATASNCTDGKKD